MARGHAVLVYRKYKEAIEQESADPYVSVPGSVEVDLGKRGAKSAGSNPLREKDV